MKKTMAAILIAICAIGALGAVATAGARPFMNWNNMDMGRKGFGMGFGLGGGIGIGNQLSQQSFARVDGLVTKFGTANATGTVEAQSRTVVINTTNTKQGASASVMWTTNTAPIAGPRAKQNFTYTVYNAGLANSSYASLNMTGYSFFLNGTWNVFQVTTNYTIITDSSGNIQSFNRNTNGVAIVTKAYGELTIPSSGSNFTLAIKGLDNITGLIHVQRITSKMFNPFIINNDVAKTTVTKQDVASVVNAYGSSPGWGNYDQRMDYNMHYKIDITDLATAAANVNSD